MSYLLDADWIISFLNGRAEAVALVAQLADRGLAISIIACGEIYEGLLASSASRRHIARFEAFTATVDVITPDLDVARRYGTARSLLRLQGLPIPDNDLWIAATALAHDLTLVSRDHHFTRVPGLQLYRQG